MVSGRRPLSPETGLAQSPITRVDLVVDPAGVVQRPRPGPFAIDGLVPTARRLTWEHVAGETCNTRGRAAYTLLSVERESEFVSPARSGHLTRSRRAALRPWPYARHRGRCSPPDEDGHVPRTRMDAMTRTANALTRKARR